MNQTQDIYILGINESHNATACLLKNGHIVGCLSEERLCRKKNVYGFPSLSIQYLLKENNITPADIARVILSFENPILLFHNIEYISDKRIPHILPFLKNIIDAVAYHVPATYKLYTYAYDNVYKRLFWDGLRRKQDLFIEKELAIAPQKIARVNHHMCHAYAVYYSYCDRQDQHDLIVTLDGIGDDSCGAVMQVSGAHLKTLAQTSNTNSPGMLYAFVTDYMGMKIGEHEYKVMGLSPYSSHYEVEKVYKRIRDIFTLGDDLVFRSKVPDVLLGRYLRNKLYKCRFDGIAGAVQKYIEELLCQYVAKAVQKTGARRIFCGGGVFMNVKANKLILEQTGTDAAYFMPSAGDESTAIGAAYQGYLDHCAHNGLDGRRIAPLKDLYLGVQYTNDDVRTFIRNNKLEDSFYIYEEKDVEKRIAELLARYIVVARLRGKMEWGARALGNRSILANPSNYAVVRILNDQIKSRDFWMPFAGTVLAERFNDYLLPTKRTDNSNMMVAYDTTARAQKELIAAIHPYDYTMRAQVLTKEYNPRYHALISEFQRLTSIGGIVNTSFNLHGEPMVCSPDDALHSLRESGLEVVAIEDFVISKKNLNA
jgi:carbamoyltransferase